MEEKMKKAGIHLNLSDNWSDEYLVFGKPTRYRLWNKKGKTFCLKLVKEKNQSIVQVSSSLENVDFKIGEIFDIPDFPFDKQNTIIYDQKQITYCSKDSCYKGKMAAKKAQELFSYSSIEILLKDLVKGV